MGIPQGGKRKASWRSEPNQETEEKIGMKPANWYAEEISQTGYAVTEKNVKIVRNY